MNTNKYIFLFCVIFFVPLLAMGQSYKRASKREVEQIGKKEYKVTTGEVTKVVNSVGSGLDEFLLRKGNSEADSIFAGATSDYSSLEEATLDIDDLLRQVELEKKLNSKTNESLGFWISQSHDRRRKKEQEATRIANNIMRKEPTVEELVREKIVFGNKPTYYINGVEVEQSFINKLQTSEIIKREIRTKDTASGNPNGEIWYMVSDKTLNRLGIPLDLTYDYGFDQPDNISSIQSAAIRDELKRKELEKKSLPVIRREKNKDGSYVDIVVPQNTDKEEVKTGTVITEEAEYDPGTRVISRSVNNEGISSGSSAYPTVKRTTPAPQRPRQSQPVVRQNTKPAKESSKEAVKKQEDEPKKKSVRRIKQRIQSQYEDNE